VPKVGDAWYELSAKDAELLAALQRDEAKIKQAGTAAEQAFSGNAKKGADELGASVDTAGKKAGGFGDTFRSLSTGVLMGVGVAAFSAVGTAVGGMTDAIVQGASSYNEALSKTRVVFGDFSGEVEAFAEDAPAKLFLTRAAALDMTSTLGNLFVSLGLGPAKAAPMSEALLQLAADLSSFNDVPVEDAFAALQSGLVGETEPLRRFGVNMNEATLTAKALELGLISSTKQGLDPAAKAQAAYALILDQTKTAQGDAARTAGSLANLQRAATATLNEGLARLGERILPVLTAILPKVMDGMVALFDLIGKGADFLGVMAEKGQDVVKLFLGPALPLTLSLAGAMVTLAGATAIGAVSAAFVTMKARGLDAITSVLDAFSGSGAKMAAEGGSAGSAWGMAFRVGALVGIASLAPEIASQAGQWAQDIHARLGLDNSFLDDIGASFSEWRQNADWPWGQKNAPDWARLGGEAEAGGHSIGGSFAQAVMLETDGIPLLLGPSLTSDAEEMAGVFLKAATQTFASSTDMDDALLGQFKGNADAWRKKGREVPEQFASGIAEERQAPLDAFDQLIEMMKHPMTQSAETARLIGQLTGKKLAEGLESADPTIRRQAELTRNAIIKRLEELKPRSGTVSKEAMDEIVAGMESKDAKIRAAAIKVYNAVKSGPDQIKKDAKGWGEDSADAYAAGWVARQGYLTSKVQQYLAPLRGMMEAFSPPKEGPLHLIDVWAENTGLAWVSGFVKGLSTAPKSVSAAMGDLAKFLKDYQPVGNEIGGFTPEVDRANLTKYIADLKGKLAETSDPTDRLSIYRQIAEYQDRLNDLQGKVATVAEEQAETLRRYISNLDKAILTEKDPAKRSKMIDEIATYLNRIDTLMAPAPAAPAAAATPAVGALSGLAPAGADLGTPTPSPAAVAAVAPLGTTQVTFNAPLLQIESFTGSDSAIDELLGKITDRLRQIYPGAVRGLGAAS
jgi:hypothetical protein